MEITVYKRHSADCEHKGDRSYKRCNCRAAILERDAVTPAKVNGKPCYCAL
jgi:hypothetical protein